MNPDHFAKIRALIGWTSIFVVLLSIILIPFFLYESAITELINSLIMEKGNRPLLAVALGSFLAADIILPVPSSLVSTALGGLLGFWFGTLTSWAGMTAGCLIGYLLGAGVGPPAVKLLAGEKEIERVRLAAERYGDWAIILFRSVPVLAEVSTVFAGLSRMPLVRFLTIAALSNLGISAAYAGVGSAAAGAGSFLLAFAGAILIPAIGWAIARLLNRQDRQG